MILEIRKYQIFLLFILLHLLFWDFTNGEVSTLIHGDWENQWQDIINANKSKLMSGYSFPIYAKLFYMVHEITGLSIYFAIIIFSLLNTFLFLLIVKILEAFDKKYSVIAALFLTLSPSSMPQILMMYKDNFIHVAFALILLIIARTFSNKPLNLPKSLFCYICAVILIVISRGSAIPYLTLMIYIALFLSFLLVLMQSYSYKNILPLLLIFLIHTFYFYVGFDKYINNIISFDKFVNVSSSIEASQEESGRVTKFKTFPIKHLDALNNQEALEIEELLEIQEVLKNQEKISSLKIEINDRVATVQETIQKSLEDQRTQKKHEASRVEEFNNNQATLQKQEELYNQELLKIRESIKNLESLEDLEILQEQEELYNQELLKIRESIINLESLEELEGLKVREELKNSELFIQELLIMEKIIFDEKKKIDSLNLKIETHGLNDSLISRIKHPINVQINNVKILIMRFFAEMRHRKISNVTISPNAPLNYDTPSNIASPKIVLLMAHIPSTIFAPYIVQMIDMNTSNIIKIVFLLETLINYILALCVFYYLLKLKFYKLFFIIVVFSCMYVTNLYDSNFGTYLRHAHLFIRLFLGMGILVLLYFLKPNININIKKGLL